VFSSKNLAARWSARVAVATLAAGALVLPAVASAQPAAPSQTAAAKVASVQQEMRAGTLVQTHGVKTICPRCQGEVVTSSPGASTPLSTSLPSGYGPSTLASDYGISGDTTSTTTIAIIDAGVDGNLAADLATYRSTYGLPACTTANGCLKLESYTGGAQQAPQKSGAGAEDEEEIAVETALDMDMASAACPSCHLLEISLPYTAGVNDNSTSTGNFATAVNTAVTAGAKAISISYGYTESSTNTSGTQLSSFNHKGVAITVSTGDSGFNGGTHQSWPSDLPTVVAVGGTTLHSATSETAWSGGGSGCETAFAAATGQPAAVTTLCKSHRAAADVSADADPNTGLAVYDTYAPYSHEPNDWIVVGGTSASAPYIGGLFARAGVASTVNGPNTLYAAAATNFKDITSGNNEEYEECSEYSGVSTKICNAGTGYDGPTGLGRPKGLGAF
jgi:hypothetical protein